MEDYTLLHTLDNLGAGDHLCCIYQTEEEHRSLVTPFISKGLERNEKVIYIVDARTAKIVLGYFQSDDLKIKRYLKSGQLSILTADDSYMRSGTFDPDGMIALLRAETEKALDEGFSALRVTGEMSWALKGLPGSERLIEYESKLNDFFPGSKCLAICQYDRRLFDPELLLSVIVTHPIVVVGTEIYENFYYLPPSEYFGADLSESILDRWLSSLEERRKIEEELRERHRELQVILDSLDAYLFHKDRAGRHVFANRALADSTGIPEDEWKGKTIVELLSGSELAEKQQADDEEVMKSGKPKKGVIEQFESPEGIRWARTDKVPFTDEDGNTIGLIGLSIDITDLKRTEQKLEESEEKYRTLVENLSEGIWAIDQAAKTTFANKRIAEMLGFTVAEMEGRPLFDFMDEEGVRLAKQNIARREQGIKEQHDFEFIRKDGERIYATLETAPLLDEEGNYAGAIAGVMDITERKRAERELEKAKEQWEKSFQAVGEAMFMIDKDLNILQFNNAFLQLVGRNAEEIPGHKCYEFVHSLEGPPDFCITCAAVRDEKSISAELYEPSLDKYLSASADPAFDEEGNFEFAIHILRDITERKRYEEKLEKINAELKAFAHTISHDLRGPLAALMGANKTLQLLLRDPDVEDFRSDIREMTEIIDSNTARAEKLITDVLSLAETAQVPLEVSDVAVREVVGKIIEEQVAAIEERDIHVSVEKDLGIVVANPAHVYQVFVNLIGNAIKYNDSDSPVIEISRSGEEEKGVHRYLIRDNGSGIPGDILDSVFNPFIKGEGGSSGVGLAIVKRIVEVYGGDVSACNDNGACFELTLKDYKE